MKLTKAQQLKVSSIQVFGEGRKSVYHVTLKEGYENNGLKDEHFGTQVEVKEFINNAVEATTLEVETDGNVYEGFYSNEAYGDFGHQTIATAMNGKFENGHTTMRSYNLTKDVEGANLVLDTVLKALYKEREAVLNGYTVDIYVKWTLSKDRSEYTSCEYVKTVITSDFGNTYKERLEGRVKALGFVLTHYDKDIDTLDEKAFKEVLYSAQEEYTDIVVVSKGKQYVVEISTVDKEKDFVFYTKSEYVNKYGEEKEEMFEV